MRRWWPLLPLLLMVLNAGAELYLLKHGEYLYCVSDDEDTPALAWNHNLDNENEPLESVYWSTPSTRYSEIDCKPQFGNQNCGNWHIRDWKIVRSYDKNLPPVFDFRWNDLEHYVVKKGNITPSHSFQPSATRLYFSVSLLARDNAIIILRNQAEGWDWRIVIDGWVKSHDKRTELELWGSNSRHKTYGFPCDRNCKGLVLSSGMSWKTFSVKYEARDAGDMLKLFNHESKNNITWTTNESLKSVEELLFYTYYDSEGLVGHWRFHLYNILEPTRNAKPLTLELTFNAANENQLCIAVTYITPHTHSVNTGVYVELSNEQETPQKRELFTTDNEWKTVKHVFTLTPGTNTLKIFPHTLNFKEFAIGEIRACSEGEFRVSKIKSGNDKVCSDLKKNITVSLKDLTVNNQDDALKQLFGTLKFNWFCREIIPNVQDCRNVTVCSTTTCTCAPGYQGLHCEQECPEGKYGNQCSKPCSTNCKDGQCNHVTGKCTDCHEKFFGIDCDHKCNANCGGNGSCHRDTGHCSHGCAEKWTGDHCNNNRNRRESGDNNENSSGSMGWLLLIPLALMICLMMYCRRKAIRKKFGECMLRVFPSQVNEDSALNMLRLTQTAPAQVNHAPAQVNPAPAQLAVPPPVQPRISLPPPVQLRVSISPPAQLGVPPPLLPRRNSLVPPAQEKTSVLVPIIDLAQYIENAVTSGQLAAQHGIFQRGLTAPSLEAERPEHTGKNRWRNVLPYDTSRVVLDILARKPHSHYVNASYIDGYLKEKAFIATQGPREETIDDFWRLVWQKNVSCIIMLCNLIEGQTLKCAQYWPALNASANHKDDLMVRTVSEDAFVDHTVRVFSVTRGDASRIVTQLHYTAWPDHGVPRYAHSLASVLRQVPLDSYAPILVHCSAGVGRTGTVILALAGYAMGQAEGVVDMLALLAKMRSQRPNMVDNATQYETAHRVLLELNTQPGCEMPIKNFHAAFRSLQGLGILQTQFWDLNEACRRDVLKSSGHFWPNDKNRFPDIVPGIEGRVILQRAGCSYINAVYVDGLRSRDRYVVTQLPLTNTLADFWLMVWQREAKMLFVLNTPEPAFFTNHIALWNKGGEIQLPESLKVRHVELSENSIFDQHRVVLRQKNPKRIEESREVSVVSVNQWRSGELTPHHPDTLLRLWSEMERVPGTVVIACHDGATASGLLVSANLMLEHLHATGIVDVASAVRRARRTRPHFIASLTQYEFLHTVALAEIETMDAYVNL